MKKEQKVGINTNETRTEKITSKKRNIFKCEVTIDDNGKIKVISYANRQLGMIPNFFNDALQDVVEQINHEADWKEKYIHFSYNGENYRQINSRNICDGCIFWENKKCAHPYKEKKGICEHKIYIKEEKREMVMDDLTEKKWIKM